MGRLKGVDSVEDFDLDRYLGLWFEIGRLPLKWEDDEARDVTASYSLNEDGSVRVDNRCINAAGEPTQAVGRAEPVEGESGQLTVTFLPAGLRWIPFTKGDYWVLKLADDYTLALVGSPDLQYLWLLARSSNVGDQERREYLDFGVSQGFDLAKWIDTPQSGGRVEDHDLA
jgi:apolipoprotein D and lipocalin family protein